MFNKKMNAGKVLILILISVIIFCLSMVFPALQAVKSIIYADTDALVDSINLTDAEFHLRIRMYDSYRDKEINILDTDSVADMVYKTTTIPGITPESVKLIYEESGFKWFLKNKLKLLQKIVTERDSAAHVTVLITADEIEALIRDNAEIIKKHTGYTLTDRDYDSVKRFFNDNGKLNQYLNSATIQANTHFLGNLKTSLILSAVIAGILIAVFFIIGLIVLKNLCASFVSAGISFFLAGFASLAAGVACRTAVFFSRIDPSNFIKFIADTLERPFVICGVILAGISVLCFIAAVLIKTVVYAERSEDNEEDDNGSFSYEYFTNEPKYKEEQVKEETEIKTLEESKEPKDIPEENEDANRETTEEPEEDWKKYWLDQIEKK